MLTELIKHKNLGNIGDILFVLQNVISEKPRTVDDIKKYCSDKSIDLIYAIDGILALLEFVGIISRSRNSVRLHKNISDGWVDTTGNNSLSKTIVETVLINIRDRECLNDFIPLERIGFDSALNRISIPNNSIPLQYSPIKNLLINLGGLKTYSDFPNFLFIDTSFQHFFETDIVPKLVEENEKSVLSDSKNGFPLDKFMELQELKNQYGAQAEEFIIEFEKIRLAEHPLREQIRRISNFDVGAGYDIVSFEDLDSQGFDRFIEVKSYSKFPEFYWSKKEVRTAEIKRDGYFLYLVDREQIGTSNYQPTIVRDPYSNIFQNPKWQKDARTWFIKQEFEIQGENSQTPKVFICYSHEDRTFAKKLSGELTDNGNRVWWDYSGLKGGQDWPHEIQKAITECKYFLVILTPKAVNSQWVGNEITLALQKNKMIIPLYLKSCEMPISIIQKQYINFEKQTHKAALRELIELLKIQETIARR